LANCSSEISTATVAFGIDPSVSNTITKLFFCLKLHLAATSLQKLYERPIFPLDALH
jgi:hypothetical protein